MRKNRTMRVAALLLALTLITSCFVGGTFAKYVTKAAVDGDARVAHWGITMTAEDPDNLIFSDTYNEGGVIGLSGTDAQRVVAPGTSNSVTYKLSGTPEVAYKLSFACEQSADVMLPAGDYEYSPLYVAADNTYGYVEETMNFTLEEDYYPLNWTVTIAGYPGGMSLTDDTLTSDDFAAGAEFDTLQEALDALNSITITGDPMEALNNAYITITWDWAFDGVNDAADTVLGDISAGIYACDAASTWIDFNVTMTAEQLQYPAA